VWKTGLDANLDLERILSRDMRQAFAAGRLYCSLRVALCALVLPVIVAAAAISMAGNQPRDLRVVLVGTVPGHSFVANEAAHGSARRTMIEA
jgi:hypothetical protein